MSTTDQNPAPQLDALAKAGCEKIFTDHGVSGTRTSRPQLDAMLGQLRRGDVVTVWKLDRVGRDTRHLLAFIDDLDKRGVGFLSLTEGISTRGPMGRAMLTVMAAFAQLERDQLAERTRAGMQAARGDGRPPGRRPVTAADPRVARVRQLKAQGLAAADIGRIIGAGRATVYRYLALDDGTAES